MRRKRGVPQTGRPPNETSRRCLARPGRVWGAAGASQPRLAPQADGGCWGSKLFAGGGKPA